MGGSRKPKKPSGADWAFIFDRLTTVAATFGKQTFVLCVIIFFTFLAIIFGGSWPAASCGVLFACIYLISQEFEGRRQLRSEFSDAQKNIQLDASRLIEAYATEEEKSELDIFEEGVNLSKETGG